MPKITVLAAAAYFVFLTPALAQDALKCDQATLDKVRQEVELNTLANDADTVARAKNLIDEAGAAMKDGKIAECEAALATVNNEFKM